MNARLNLIQVFAQFQTNIFLIIVLSLAGGCSNGSIDELKSENKELKSREMERDSIMKNLVAVFASVDSNMKAISKNEIRINRQITGKKTQEVNEDSILYYIRQIDTLASANQKLVDRLEKKYGSQNFNIIGLRQLIASLNDKNQFKNSELGELKGKLATINDDFRKLFEDFVYTEVERMELNESNAALKEKNEKLQDELNAVYYVIGSKTELKEKGLVDSKGIFFEKDMSKTLNKDHFIKEDKRDLTFIELKGRKATLISPHPEGSYEFIGTKKSADKLLIKEPKEFWSVSSHLLIEIED